MLIENECVCLWEVRDMGRLGARTVYADVECMSCLDVILDEFSPLRCPREQGVETGNIDGEKKRVMGMQRDQNLRVLEQKLLTSSCFSFTHIIHTQRNHRF